MTSSYNNKTILETLKGKLRIDSKLLSDFSTILSFGTAAAAGEPLSISAGIAVLTKTAGATISASIEVLNMLSSKDNNAQKINISNYDKFNIQFYIMAQRCYVKSISETLITQASKLDLTNEIENKDSLIAILKKQLDVSFAKLQYTGMNYGFCNVPSETDNALFDAYDDWLTQLLAYYGIPDHVIQGLVESCSNDARRRFRVLLSSDEDGAKWVMSYLAITKEERAKNKITSDLTSILKIMEGWTDPETESSKKMKEAWDEYRKTLFSLPDLKETMFNEDFGVRKVFVQPAVLYNRTGQYFNKSTNKSVPDLGKLLGALLSNRTPTEDLILLCGGPGSGKSTLCRFIASELASNSSITPVFLKLRRAKEGRDLCSFIEESMIKLGLISKISDLRQLSNLIIILDGFDELVMASRVKLRSFFNILMEEHNTGPLRGAKILVSGRDTLFPLGEGLPNGSHVLSLLPFDKNRVTKWGEKWRLQHQEGPGSHFSPEAFLDQIECKTNTALHHLVSWPLTLHLVARVHTSGMLNLSHNSTALIEKAYIYRSILSETSNRQMYQAQGKGRLDANRIREFLKELAWEMYIQGRETMEPEEVTPILQLFFPDSTDYELLELADVAVVNSPELSKGEETGFEFVHKSFTEYLVAEKLAGQIEIVIFKSHEYGSLNLTWRMTDQEALRSIKSSFLQRIITQEIQTMLDPMLGCLSSFLTRTRADELVDNETRVDGLERVINRFEILYFNLLSDPEMLSIVFANIKSVQSAFAHVLVGILLVGSAAVKQLHGLTGAKQTLFKANPFNGAFWKAICILYTGGIVFDEELSKRIIKFITVSRPDLEKLDDSSSPIKYAFLEALDGYDPTLLNATAKAEAHIIQLYDLTNLLTYIVVRMAEINRMKRGVASTSYKNMFDENNKLSQDISSSVHRSYNINAFETLITSNILPKKHSTRRILTDKDQFENVVYNGVKTNLTMEEIPKLLYKYVNAMEKSSIDSSSTDIYKLLLEAIRYIQTLV